jgi:hypothetical protein
MTRAQEIRIRCKPFRNEAGSILAFLTLELPSGLVLNDCKLMVGPRGRRWIALPSAKQFDARGVAGRDANGKPLWTPLVEFKSRPIREKFEEQVLCVLRRRHPELFAGETPQ